MYNDWECSIVLNSPNTPELNPAELVIGLLKKKVRIRLYRDHEDLIEEIVQSF